MDDALFRQNLKQHYPTIVRGEGAYVFDAEGRRYFDATSGGVWVVNIGHGVREIVEAMAQQSRRLSFAFSGDVDNEPERRLAERIAAFAPEGMTKVFFVNTGTEATETAVKIARLYHLETGNPQKHKVICRLQSYHGSSFGALSFSGRAPRRENYIPYLVDHPRIPPVYCYQCPYDLTYPACRLACAHALEEAILVEGADTVSCFIAEPVVGSQAGSIAPPPDYFPTIRAICDRHNVLLIVDEVMTGFGRTGRNFGVDHWDVTPDLIAVGKGISSGYAPLAGVVVRDGIYQAIKDGSGVGPIGFTYAGNPVSCAAGLAVQDYLAEHDLVNRAAQLGQELFAQAETLRNHALVGDIRGLGLLLGIEIVQDKASRRPFDRQHAVAESIAMRAFGKGMWLRFGSGGVDGVNGDYLMLAPPFVATEDDLRFAVDVIGECLDETRRNLPL